MKTPLSRLLILICLVVSPTAFSSTITDDEIDKFLVSVPKTRQVLDEIKAKIEKDRRISKQVAKAQLDGDYMREVTRVAKAWPEYPALEKLVKQSGFTSVDDWSLVVDRVFGVILSARWVVLTASMPRPNSDAPLFSKDTNLFAYLGEEKNDPKLRKKYEKQLLEMCASMCYDTSDLAVVGPRYDEIESVITKRK